MLKCAPTISVVIPAYNAATVIEEALDSVLAQTLAPHEVIVVDDGSTDNTIPVVEKYASSVKLLRQSNGGAAAARNTGIQAATGEWVAFLDADDTWAPEKLEKQAAYIAKHPETVLVYTGFLLEDRFGCVTPRQPIPPDEFWPSIRWRSPVNTSSALIRREALLRVGGFDTAFRLAQDWNLWYRLYRDNPPGSFGAVYEPLCFYRRWEGNATNKPLALLQANEQMVESVTRDLRGSTRWLWRRRILARVYFETAIELREREMGGHLRMTLRSLASWPFGGECAAAWKRYKTLLHMLFTETQALVRSLVAG